MLDEFSTTMDRLFELDDYCKDYVYKNYDGKINTDDDISKYFKKKFKFSVWSKYECDYIREVIEINRKEKWKKKIRARERRKVKKLATN
jgi:hypothetical protein